MKAILRNQGISILRFDSGEDVILELLNYCTEKGITAAFFSGLGACGEILLSYYDLQTKSYVDRSFSEDLEIISLTGNVAVLNGNHVIHAHGVFSRRDYSTLGGHINKLVVSATCELHLTELEGSMERKFDKKTGLNLLS
jgi:uncharacterized protein